LLCVWFELGRPLRALNVFLNPRTSWMARESIAATLLFPVGLAAAFAMPELLWLAALLALAFVYCQGRMLQAAKGIVAWREPMLVPLMVVTGLTEGAGLYWLLSAAQSQSVPGSLLLFGALMLLRYVLWRAWRARLAAHAAPRALAAIDAAGRVLLVVGTLLPLALIATAALLPAGSSSTALAAAAGALAAVCGAWFKFTLVRRGGFNQGFALAHLPVRGARRQP
jgi:phenylacetyl-CoA:acceptor oxidoreductase subunit 2